MFISEIITEKPAPHRKGWRIKFAALVACTFLLIGARGCFLAVRLAWDINYLDMALIDSHEYLDEDKIVEGAIAHGMGVNIRLPSGETPLVSAAQKGSIKMILPLLNHGADIETRDSGGHTALENAVAVGNKEVEILLLSRGARRSAPNKAGKTGMDHSGELKLPEHISRPTN